MKISVIGAGNVGGLAALRIAQEGLGTVVLVDIVKGIAQGKATDTKDAQALVKRDYDITGTEDITQIKDSDIVVVTAGLARKPGMTREDLCKKNSEILKTIGQGIKQHAPCSVVIIVTNPVDTMTHYMRTSTGLKPNRVFGMGITLDAARFANLISEELKVPVSKINPCVIGSHGEGMIPLCRLTTVEGRALDTIIDAATKATLLQRTIDRGKEIVALFGSGSAYAAPSAAIAELVGAVARDEKRTLGVSAFLSGQWGLRDVCIGVPCLIGQNGVEKIIELDLMSDEKKQLMAAAASIKEQFNSISV